ASTTASIPQLFPYSIISIDDMERISSPDKIESMYPAFERGDLLFLSMTDDPIRVGDIVVYKIANRDPPIPIVHRVISVHDENKTREQYLLTEGDNNAGDDRPLYNRGQMWVKRSDVVGRVKGFLPCKRQLAHQSLNFFLIVSSALMIWKGLTVFTNSESPIVVVLSESMYPAFERGDLLFLSMGNDPIRVGDIVVYKIANRNPPIPIVHRVISVHDENKTGEQYLLTKGDNNAGDDRGLYNRGQMWVKRSEVVGRVKGFLPLIGMVTIILTDYPYLKVVLLVVMGMFVLLSKED
ncbi:Signal peptidase complex catalytic subunit S11C, partial [Blyttiomyces sp. JEL0837]